MESIIRNKWQLRFAALVIFLLGMAAGALAPVAYHAWTERTRAPRHVRFEQMLDKLQLSPEQRTQVKQILDETRERLGELRRESRPRVEEIRRQADERLQQVLTPEQWAQFQALRREGRSAGRRGRGGDRRDPEDR
jgi:Spy/CpxP family protein refolding chaperone